MLSLYDFVMHKLFKEWFVKKEKIHNDKKRVFFHEREVWWCSFGSNIGDEQDGKGQDFARPVLIFKKFNNQICWVLPLTTKLKNNIFHSPIFLEDKILRLAILSQLRLVDCKRFGLKIGVINSDNYAQIKKSIILLLE